MPNTPLSVEEVELIYRQALNHRAIVPDNTLYPNTMRLCIAYAEERITLIDIALETGDPMMGAAREKSEWQSALSRMKGE